MNDFNKPWVILLDDDEDDRFLIHQAFRTYSSTYLLQALEKPEELFQLLDDSVVLPALILLDLNMPLMNGFEVLKQLRSRIAYAAIPIVILTTSEAESDRRLARDLGANSFITKPPTLGQLLDIIIQLEQRWLVNR